MKKVPSPIVADSYVFPLKKHKHASSAPENIKSVQ